MGYNGLDYLFLNWGVSLLRNFMLLFLCVLIIFLSKF